MKFVAIAVIAAVVIFHVVESAPKRSDSAAGRPRSQPPCSPDEDSSFGGFDQRRGRQGGSNGGVRFGSRGGNRGGFQQDEDWEGDEN